MPFPDAPERTDNKTSDQVAGIEGIALHTSMPYF
jgi:hypothetical protein